MSFSKLLRSIAVAGVITLAAFSTIGHPAFLNMYARDPRAKPELRTDCTICHTAGGKATDAKFFTEFGRAFKNDGNIISNATRDRFSDLFIPREEPVSGVSADTIKFETAQVAIKVSVINARGQFVTGLDREAFKILEDGREQDVLQMTGEDSPLALAVLIDTSGSALKRDLQRFTETVLDLAEALRSTDVFAIYSFGGTVEMKRDFSSEIADLKPVLGSLKAGGGSPMHDAILKAAEDLRKRPERRRAILLLSDGSESGSRANLRETVQGTFLTGISVYPIDLIVTERSSRSSVERQAAAQSLERVAAETGGRYLTTPGGFSLAGNRGKLKRSLLDLIDELHSQYTIVYEPENARRAGRWRTIQIQMEQSDLNARTRLGYREGVQ